MKLHPRILALAAVAAAFVSHACAAGDTYTIDAVHSSVAFSVRHFVSKVPGKFTKFSGAITVDKDNPANNAAEATIETASLSTENQRRDDHVRSADFLDAAKFPTIKFKSTAWTKTGDNTFDVKGNLTIKDVTRPVTLKVTLLGIGPGMPGTTLSGWEATTTIDKKDFHVIDPPMLDAALGDDVAITINVEADKKD
ncbi:MAG TPA: YceI family protein [Opitutaceae bacterium]|nr:YceI family protein [Opitutaceae bacterium]